MVTGRSWLARDCFSADGISRGAGQSRHLAMRCNARVAFVFWAGPPLGHEAAPDRAVRRPNWGRANPRNYSHARLVWIGRNKTRLLSLTFVAEVNPGTRTGSGEQVRAALREFHKRSLSCNSSHPRLIASSPAVHGTARLARPIRESAVFWPD